MKVKMLAVAVTAMMIFSGLGILTIGADTGNIVLGAVGNKVYGSIPGYVPHSVQRTALAEDFTEWGCGPCAGHNPQWTGAIDAVGYDIIAPAYVHVWWPVGTDPIYAYCDGDGSVTERVNYYGVLGVPDTFLDGGDIATGQTQAAYETAFQNAAAIPSSIILDTSGSNINDVLLDGVLNLHIEASDAIASSNLKVFVYLWETNIIRALDGDAPPYPNGETELDWAVWDILPDGGTGDPIWPAGASPGDWIDVSYPLTLGAEWIADDIGCTVFIQDTATREVYQATVELFDNQPPVVSLDSPDSYLAEQVLGGTIPITWTATDYEDDDNTLDISIDYSADGGNTWINIMSGTDNNVAPFTFNWDTVAGGIPDGIGYKLQVKALDSLGNFRLATSSECFTIDNIADDEWYFQVESTGALQDLSVQPAETSINIETTADITVAGDYQVGAWETIQTFSGKSINGDWTFRTYGKTPNPGLIALEGYLYAKVFSSSNMATPIYATTLDNENVGIFQASHLFEWTEALSGDIVSGDSLVIEIWLNVVGGPYTSGYGETLNPGFDTDASSWAFNIWVDGDGKGLTTGSYQAAGGNPGGYVDVYLPNPQGKPNDYYEYSGYWEQSFTTGFVPYSATLLVDFKYIVPSTDTTTITYFAFVDTAPGTPVLGTEVWSTTVEAITPWITVEPTDLSHVVNADTTYYLKMAFKHDSINMGEGPCVGGYDNIQLTWENPYPVFEMEYDYGPSQSHIVPTIGDGVPPINYDIDTSGESANGWVFISYPITATGNVSTVFDDDGWGGGGGTTWDRIMWYDPADVGGDHWKSYNTAYPGTQDMPNVNNRMGFWVHLLTNDNILTIGEGQDPTGTTINLEAGWNLVGFPSQTEGYTAGNLKTDSGDGGMIIQRYNDAAAYDIELMPDVDNFQEGNAYWVYATAAYPWTVAP